MRRHGNCEFFQKGVWRQGIALLALFWVAGCTMLGLSDPASQDRANNLAILLSDESPAFRRVAQEMASQAGKPIENFRLDGSVASQAETLRRLQRSTHSTVVAIGLPAARGARRLTGKQVVFCQVSSHEEESLVSPLMKGVSAIPPVREQFRAWRALNPKLRTVGVITGPQQSALLTEARQSARANGLELIAVEVKSDRETLYAFKRLSPRVQGLWLVPDNRVLSNAVLLDLMAHAVKEGKQVLAFSHELLALGALLSVESSPADIAGRVLARTRETSAKSVGVLPLTRVETRVNATMLRRFGLTVPSGFEGKLHAS
jgi:ABC-type uncharacterized transport system substrate-binding protein